MNQPSFLANSHQKKLRCGRFLDEMQAIIPWDAFLTRVLPLYPVQATVRKRTDVRLLLWRHLRSACLTTHPSKGYSSRVSFLWSWFWGLGFLYNVLLLLTSS